MKLCWQNPEGFARKRRVDDLETQIAELSAHLHAATWRLLQLVREFDELDGVAGTGAKSLAHWLHWRCGFALPAAREKVRVARALPALPKISEAFRQGRLSYAKVRALTRIATPANEDTLLGWAEYGNASHLEKLARLYRRYGDDAAARAQYRQRECSYYTDEDGSLVIRARLPAELGAIFLKALEAARSELQDVSAETHPASIEGNATDVSAETPRSPDGMEPAVSGDEDVSAETRGPWLHWKDHSTTWDPDASAEAEPDTRFRRNADAIVRLAERYLAPDAEPRALGERFQVHVHLDLCRRASGPVEDPDTPSLARETIRRLGCEANLVPVVHDGESGEILSVGRRTRAIPPHIRRALRLRDGGCRFPGCTNHQFVDAHHVVHWADGGETKLSNLLELCRFHHRLLHEGGFGLAATDDGLLVFSRPDGSRIDAISAPPDTWTASGIALEWQQVELPIDHRTCATKWDGSRMDYGIAIDILDQRKRHRPPKHLDR